MNHVGIENPQTHDETNQKACPSNAMSTKHDMQDAPRFHFGAIRGGTRSPPAKLETKQIQLFAGGEACKPTAGTNTVFGNRGRAWPNATRKTSETGRHD